MNPLISVIIPVYNVEAYLDECVESVIGQTYKNLEILLIDDGSTDNSGTICDQYKNEDPRIKVIHKENSGVAETRNLGIEQSKGDFVCFVDSDDYVTSDYVKLLYDQLIKNDADISCCSFAYKYPNGSERSPLCRNKPEDYVQCDRGRYVLENMLYGNSIYLPSCCWKLFKKSAIGNTCFPKYKIGEDFLASLDFYSKAEKVVFINRVLYFYRQNAESAMHTSNLSKFYDIVLSGDEIYKKAVSIDKHLKNAASHYVIEMNMIALMRFQYCKNENEKINHIKDNIKKFRKTVIFDKKARPKIRISCMVSLFGFNVLCKIRNATVKE